MYLSIIIDCLKQVKTASRDLAKAAWGQIVSFADILRVFYWNGLFDKYR